MLKLSSIMIGSHNPKELVAFYVKVLDKKPDMVDGDWAGWETGGAFLGIGNHDKVKVKASEPERILFNLETSDVKGEFKRISGLGATVIKAPYEMGSFWIATFADPDDNYFQLMTPWK